MSDLMVIVVFAPRSDAQTVRDALADAGAGALGDYSGCSFTAPGHGRFRPGPGADPTIGTPGEPETVEEERIEAICPRAKVRVALTAMLAVHPYEEPAYHVYEALTIDEF